MELTVEDEAGNSLSQFTVRAQAALHYLAAQARPSVAAAADSTDLAVDATRRVVESLLAEVLPEPTPLEVGDLVEVMTSALQSTGQAIASAGQLTSQALVKKLLHPFLETPPPREVPRTADAAPAEGLEPVVLGSDPSLKALDALFAEEALTEVAPSIHSSNLLSSLAAIAVATLWQSPLREPAEPARPARDRFKPVVRGKSRSWSDAGPD